MNPPLHYRDIALKEKDAFVKAATQSLPRCCRNYNRASYEMVIAWAKRGAERNALFKRWMASPQVDAITAEIIFTQTFKESVAQVWQNRNCHWRNDVADIRQRII